jgi:hypothetical protein
MKSLRRYTPIMVAALAVLLVAASLPGVVDLPGGARAAETNARGSACAPCAAEDQEVSSRSLIAGFPAEFCNRCAAAIALLMGAVALGTERRSRWVAPFFGHLFGTGPARVRGYLKPVDLPGKMTARANVGLENPGLSSVRVGAGTPFIDTLRETEVEFVGTKDGTPPELRVERGTVLVDGVEVQSKQLEDGDVIEFEGQTYRYLRGNRR